MLNFIEKIPTNIIDNYIFQSIKRRRVTGLDTFAQKYIMDNTAVVVSKIQEHISGSDIKGKGGK